MHTNQRQQCASLRLLATTFLFFIASCGGRGDNDGAEARFQCTHQISAPPTSFYISTALPRLDTFLESAPSSPLTFSRYDLKAGMSYSYGFSIFDFDCDDQVDISFFDSFYGKLSPTRNDMGVDGYMKWNSGPLESIVRSDSYVDAGTLATNGPSLFERHVPLDVNHDGLTDIVGVANSHASVVAYLNPGIRNQPWPKRYLTTEADGALNIIAADIDGDEDQDLVVAMRLQLSTNPSAAEGGLIWLENPGPSHPHDEWLRHHFQGSEDLVNPRTLQAADLDGDGRVDVLVSDAESGTLRWFRQATNGDSWESLQVPGVTTAFGHYGVVADLDSDGRMDILQPVYRGIQWMRNLGGGNNWESIPVVSFEQDGEPLVVAEVAIGDLDGDGRTDIAFAVASFTNDAFAARRGGVYWLRQGLTGWEAYKIQNEESAVVGISLSDYDGNGSLDVVSNTEYQRQAVTLWINPIMSQSPRIGSQGARLRPFTKLR